MKKNNQILNKREFLSNQSTKKYIDNLIRVFFTKQIVEESLGAYKWPNNKNALNFEQTYQCFQEWRKNLNIAINQNCQSSAYQICKDVLEWGGVGVAKKNIIKIEEIKKGKRLISLLKKAKETINAEQINIDKIDFPVNSGFSKVYTCLSENFIIYDSRVAAKMCSLSNSLFKDENPLNIGKAAYNAKVNRNPGKQFPMISGNNKKYFDSIIKAAWIIEDISKKHEILNLKQDKLIFAFQTTLFHAGYEI